MTKLTTLSILIGLLFHTASYSQESYGKSLNLGVGIGGYAGYYRYVGRSLPVVNINYEFDVAKSFTLAPFVSFYSYTNNYYWGNNNKPSRYYNYRETVIPVGVKGTYYFDALVGANSKWDFYLAASLGFAIVNSRWDDGYEGDRNYYSNGRPLLGDFHAGAEYHFNSRLGIYLDLSGGVSTLGLAFHGIK